MKKIPIPISQNTGISQKFLLKENLKKNDYESILNIVQNQNKQGIELFDINFNGKGPKEVEIVFKLLYFLKERVDAGFVIDTQDIFILKEALNILKDKNVIVNSYNPANKNTYGFLNLAVKYDKKIIALAMDGKKLPCTAQKKLEAAEKILQILLSGGMKREDIIIDALATPVKYYKNSDIISISSLKLIREKLCVNTLLGIANISYGCEKRDEMDFEFFVSCAKSGLDYAIIDPYSKYIMDFYNR